MEKWRLDQKKSIDIICMGRVAIDLYAEQIGVPLENATSFRKYLGGSAGNTAVASARLGLRTAMFSKVGKDAMGTFLKHELLRESINVHLLSETPQHLTALVILGIDPPDRFPLLFYRNECADMQLKEEDVDELFFSNANAFLLNGTAISTAAMRKTVKHAISIAKRHGLKIIFDIDFRPVLWGLTEHGDGETRYKASQIVSSFYQEILPYVDLIVGTEEEIQIAGDAEETSQALHRIRLLTEVPIVLKKGKNGCEIYFKDHEKPISIPAIPVKVVNVLGAGDAFMGGLLRGLLRNEDWVTAATYANACGSIVVTKHGCAPHMPYFDEIITLINENKG